MSEPNIIKVAVTAAGGRGRCAERMGVSVWTVTHWCRSNSMPADKVRALAAMTGGVVTTDAILAYIEAAALRVAA
jgi:DNA-binding transcriptional regulator YdaS (Cro superfamily)